ACGVATNIRRLAGATEWHHGVEAALLHQSQSVRAQYRFEGRQNVLSAELLVGLDCDRALNRIVDQKVQAEQIAQDTLRDFADIGVGEIQGNLAFLRRSDPACR